jgi:hypothetical protein
VQLSDLKPGDAVGFSTPDTFGKVIRFGQRRVMHVEHWQVNHVAVVVALDPTVIVQSVRVVDEVALSTYFGGGNEIFPLAFPGPDSRRGDVVAFARSCLGRKYGVLSVISRALNDLTPKAIQINANRAGDMDCSCLVSRAWEHGSLILPFPDVFQVTPGQLFDAYPS